MALPRYAALKALNLFGNCLNGAAMEALSDALAACITLEWLDLSGNEEIGDRGAAALARGMPPNLEELVFEKPTH